MATPAPSQTVVSTNAEIFFGEAALPLLGEPTSKKSGSTWSPRRSAIFVCVGYLCGLGISMCHQPNVRDAVTEKLMQASDFVVTSMSSGGWQEMADQDELRSEERLDEEDIFRRVCRADDHDNPQCIAMYEAKTACRRAKLDGFVMQSQLNGLAWNKSPLYEIYGRATWISEGGEFVTYWCDHSSRWTVAEASAVAQIFSGLLQNGQCPELASAKGTRSGVFQDVAEWEEIDTANQSAANSSSSLMRVKADNVKVMIRTGVSSGDEEVGDWVDGDAVTCR